jgi:hypothetical protein
MHKNNKPTIDLTGQRFGKLVAQHFISGDGKKAWHCICDCGNAGPILGANLRTGRAKSCGCTRKENLRNGLGKKHGMFGSRTYKSWQSMIERCNDKNNPSYARYGGAGITVCERWKNFEFFMVDMGIRPDGMTLDRKDNSKGYSPENCRWATYAQQANNRSNNRKVHYQGNEYTAKEFAEMTGMNYHTMRHKIFRDGVSPESLMAKANPDMLLKAA